MMMSTPVMACDNRRSATPSAKTLMPSARTGMLAFCPTAVRIVATERTRSARHEIASISRSRCTTSLMARLGGESRRLQRVHARVQPTGGDQLVMGAAFDDLAVLEHRD